MTSVIFLQFTSDEGTYWTHLRILAAVLSKFHSTDTYVFPNPPAHNQSHSQSKLLCLQSRLPLLFARYKEFRGLHNLPLQKKEITSATSQERLNIALNDVN